jgi:RNA polymerase sigma-70 factor (ECF subfamily)
MIAPAGPCHYSFVANADSVDRPALLSPRDAGVFAREGTADRPERLRDLFDRQYPAVWRLLRRLGVEVASLDDAAQEVFWVAARRLGDIRVGSEQAFLYGVALRVASYARRRRRSDPPLLELAAVQEPADPAPSPEQALERQQARELLDAVLDRLPHELRVVFVLFELEGLSVKAIADLEGLAVGTASSRLRRAREEFSAVARRVRATLTRKGGVRP